MSSGTINATNAHFSVVLQSFIGIFHFVKSIKFFLFLLFVLYGSKWFFISTEMCSPLSLLVMKYFICMHACISSTKCYNLNAVICENGRDVFSFQCYDLNAFTSQNGCHVSLTCSTTIPIPLLFKITTMSPALYACC